MKLGHSLRHLLIVTAAMLISTAVRGDDEPSSIEAKTKIHRLSTTNRSPYDAFAYVNRIPESPGEGEGANDLSGRIFGRLANQEGRILLKLPPGMDRQAYQAFKIFFQYEKINNGKTGNCAVCHTPIEFTDFKKHVVTKDGSPVPTPSLRNLRQRKVNLEQVLADKIVASQQKQSGEAAQIDDAYSNMNITQADIPGLIKFLNQLNDVDDESFRKLILDATLLDTSQNPE